MSLIARRRELAAVERLLDRVAAGSGGHLVVTGPAGAGKTALLDAAAELARARAIPVSRMDADDLSRLTAQDGPSVSRTDPDGRSIAPEGPRLMLIDDVDRAGPQAAERLAGLTSAPGSGLLAAGSDPLGLTPELSLRGLTEGELAELVPDLPAGAVHAVWLASGGLPGAALTLADELAGLDPADDPLIHLALSTPSRAAFLDLDAGLIRLLETAAGRPSPPATHARVLARLARELLGDPSAAGRRRKLIDDASAAARTAADPGAVAEVLDARLHALWDPAAAQERLTTAAQIVEQARLTGDGEAERRGLFWRFVALAELGELASAEAALTAYSRAGELAGDAEAAVMVLARQSMLATVRGRFDTAAVLAEEVAVRGRRAGLADTERLVGSLRSAIDVMRGDVAAHVEVWQDLARRLPGHFFEATAARALAESGRGVEAGLELERLLPAVLAGSGPRWIGAVADLAIVASRAGEPAAAEALYAALLPYRGRLVVWGGANTIAGPVDDYLGRLAARLGRTGDALSHLDRAVETEERIGALPWLAHTLVARASAARDRAGDDLARARSIAERLGLAGLLAELAPPADEWRLTRDGDDWRLDAGPEAVRLRDGRGVRYLRTLLAAPGQDPGAGPRGGRARVAGVRGGAGPGRRRACGVPAAGAAARRAARRGRPCRRRRTGRHAAGGENGAAGRAAARHRARRPAPGP
ncbi:ATP-binding protein [Nonomuraea terrae]|uniref:ATP-binding protein n=1 Tax=Nonomuraea terrae TaxID=2530383 RepID=UPI00140556D9|nr:ATP-binding protein [Nonomuraea terrae]